MTPVSLDLLGNISLVLQVVILFLLILGILFVKGIGAKKNLSLHGYLTVFALILHTILVFVVMLPTIGSGFGGIGELSLANMFIVYSHAILGSAAEILGFVVVVVVVVVGYWISKPLPKFGCARVKKVMLPLFVIWAISVANGALIHILELL
jgi:hypothetical protein